MFTKGERAGLLIKCVSKTKKIDSRSHQSTAAVAFFCLQTADRREALHRRRCESGPPPLFSRISISHQSSQQQLQLYWYCFFILFVSLGCYRFFQCVSCWEREFCGVGDTGEWREIEINLCERISNQANKNKSKRHIWRRRIII